MKFSNACKDNMQTHIVFVFLEYYTKGPKDFLTSFVHLYFLLNLYRENLKAFL